MGKETKELWVVEVSRAYGTGQQPGNWYCVSQCCDCETAISVADALNNFMRTGLICGDFHTRTRLVDGKGE